MTLEVGEAKEPVKVFRDVLSAVSPYFRKALNGPFIESGHDTLPIPDFNVQVVKTFQD